MKGRVLATSRIGIILLSFSSTPTIESKERTFMINPYFAFATTRARIRRGPLGPYIDGFAKLITDQGFAIQTGRLKLRFVADLSSWLDRKQLLVEGLDEERVKAFLRTQKHVGERGHRSTVKLLLRHLRHLGVIPNRRQAVAGNPLDRIARDYSQFLLEQRGLSQRTVDHYVSIVRRFLGRRFGKGRVCLSKLCVEDVARFIVRYSAVVWPGNVQLTSSVLRSFLGFLTQQGKIRTNLAASVPSVARWRLSELPQFLEPAQVEKLIAGCDRNSQVGRRDYAALLLLARLGLRAGELVHLALDDIDWTAGEVLIRGKSAREQRLPLLPEVGRALAEYLKRDRPACACRRVFTRAKAPFQGFSGSAAVGNILRRALARVDLDPPLKGAHLLRRSLATHLLGRGTSISQIGEVLRHEHAQTTEIYAKVDIVALRALAQPWPGGAR
jgi:site-specific recombinase XerD